SSRRTRRRSTTGSTRSPSPPTLRSPATSPGKRCLAPIIQRRFGHDYGTGSLSGVTVTLGRTALGSWIGGRFMPFGEPLADERLLALLRPDEQITTVITSDVYGQGAADEMVGAALAGLPRERYQLVGMVGHDFYDGERAGAKGYPRFTDPALRTTEG